VYTPRNDPNRVQALVDELKVSLAIPEAVHVSVVPANPRMVSVEPLRQPQRAFLLSLEDAFLDQLNDGDLRAVIAHELGHVWIFTHHPYLQTEQLANQIAMRVVSRESLAEVYGKVWERAGTKGDLARFLGTVTVATR
jgi:Zn-dependent protease with chaperone function